ncbi:C40 family peptidase [Pseudonocardia terrae]|uniref:C40 family peptidase n=1 Tax=Pseudonocardia terrae TaxID=2905831 RepID=UPI003557B42E
MALRERVPATGSRSVTKRAGRHRAGSHRPAIVVPQQRGTSHRWATAEDDGRERRREVRRVVPPGHDRAVDGPGAGVESRSVRAEAARSAAAGLAGARLATALVGRVVADCRREAATRIADRIADRIATARTPLPRPGVVDREPEPGATRTLPVRYRGVPARRRSRFAAGVWVLLGLLLVVAVAVPSAVRQAGLTSVAGTAAERFPGVFPENTQPGPGGGGPVAPAPAEFTTALPDGRAQVALAAALSQVGVPYQWGGNGPAAGDQGFDCSGLTVFAYGAAGITLPRTAHSQYVAGPHVPADAPLQPGDLVFYGIPSAVHHVGVYLGDGRMVNAPTYGKPVRTSYYRWRGDDYLGATRPAAPGPRTSGMLQVLPEPRVTSPNDWPRTFDAPAAPAPAAAIAPSASLPPESVTAAAAMAASAGPLSVVDGASPNGTAPESGGAVFGDPAAAPASGQASGGQAWRPAAATWRLPSADAADPAAGAPAPAADPAGPAGPIADAPAHRAAPTAASAGSPPAAAPAGSAPPASPASSAPPASPADRTAVAAGDHGNDAASPAPADTARPGAAPAPTVGTLTLPSGELPLTAARLDDAGVPVVPAPGTAALLDEGGAQLVVLRSADDLPLDQQLTVAVTGAEPRSRTVVEASPLSREQLAEHIRTLPPGEFQVVAAAPDGTWTLAELE